MSIFRNKRVNVECPMGKQIPYTLETGQEYVISVKHPGGEKAGGYGDSFIEAARMTNGNIMSRCVVSECFTKGCLYERTK